MHYLWLMVDLLGNKPPAIGAAQRLVAAGHTVTFAGFSNLQSTFVDAGFPYLVLEASSEAHSALMPDTMTAAMTTIFFSELHSTEIPQLLQRTSCDAVIVDCLMFGALAAFEKQPSIAGGRRVLIYVHSTVEAMCEISMFPAPLNGFRAKLGLQPVQGVWEPWVIATQCNPPALRTGSIFVVSVAELDSLKAIPREAHHVFRHIGPQLPTLTKKEEQYRLHEWNQIKRSPLLSSTDPRPLVLASFSTGTSFPQYSRYQRTIAALSDSSRYRVLATYTNTKLGPSTQDNVLQCDFVPHSVVMPMVSAVVTHAGHGTTISSLTYGRPVVTLPNWGDQPCLAAKVAALGAGVDLPDNATPFEEVTAIGMKMKAGELSPADMPTLLDAKASTPDQIHEAVNRVLTEPSYRQSSQALQAIIQRYITSELTL